MATFEPNDTLRDLRFGRHLSREQLATQLGTSSINVGRWERGEGRPNPSLLARLCAFFALSPQELGFPGLHLSTPLAPVTTTLASIYDPTIPLRSAIDLVGRDAVLERLKQRLCADGNMALTALNGLPGVGKTSLASALAHDLAIRAHFRAGILWAGLGPMPNLPGLLRRWGALLGISADEMLSLQSQEDWSRTLRVAIGERAMLLVIDDAWKLEDALLFKVGGPNCAHLVTTRFPTIATRLTADGAIALQELNTQESITLLQRLAPDVLDAEIQKGLALVQAVGGLPLALTLLGNYLRTQAYSGPARRIHAALQRLSDAEVRLHISEPRSPLENHPSLPVETSLSLQSVIAVTDQLLSTTTRAALYALAVFPPKPDTFSEEAALAIAACSSDELDTLIDTGLLESNGSDRYTLHQVIADYARIHLHGQAALDAYDRLLAFVLTYIEMHKKDYELLELESSTILAALELAHEQNRQTALVQAVGAFAPFLILRGFYAQAAHHLRLAHDAALALGDDAGMTKILLYQGKVTQRQGTFTQALAHFQQGLTLARQLGDDEQICDLLVDLGAVIWRQGEYTQAKAYLQEGLALARQLQDRGRISSLLATLGSVYGDQGDFVRAESYLQEGLILARQIGDRKQICSLCINLGAVFGGQGLRTRAETYFQEGLTLARQIGQSEQICVLLINLGDIKNDEGNYVQAEMYLQEGLTLARQIGHREWTSVLLINLGASARKQEHYSRATAYLQEALTLARQIGRPRITCNVLYEYGNLYLRQQHIAEAEASFRAMLEAVSSGDQEMLALAHYGLARAASANDDLSEARRLGEISLSVLQTMGHGSTQEVHTWLDTLPT